MILIKTGEMLGKLILFTTFCLFLFVEGVNAQLSPWRRVDVQAVIHSHTYLLEDGRSLKLLGVKGVDLLYPDKNEVCLTKNIKWFLRDFLINQPTLIRIDEHGYGHLKVGKVNLSESLLSRGWAQLLDSDHYYGKRYRQAEILAQQQHLGRWGQCDAYLPMVKWQKAHGRTPWFWDRYHPYLGTVAMGRVEKVLSHNLFVLDNGLRVRLAEIPIVQDDSVLGNCVERKTRNYLEAQVLGRQVRLSRGSDVITQYKTIVRQVDLPATRWRSALNINQLVDKYRKEDAFWQCLKPLIGVQ